LTLSRDELLRKDVGAIALPEGRMVGTAAHARARAYLCRRFAEIGLVPYRDQGFELSYQGRRTHFHNLVGLIAGRNPRLPPVVIGAHYDSVIAAPCADDNAAAVAIALSAADMLRTTPRERDVVVALFDAEEPPYFLGPAMGSIRFCADQADGRGFHAALVMDLVGHDCALPLPGLANLLIATGIESSATLPGMLDACPRPADLPLVVAQNYVVGDMSDHHAFRSRGTPYLFLTCGRWAHYHRPTDTPEKLAWRKIGLIRDYVVALVNALASSELEAPSDDTIAMEIRYLEAALGVHLGRVLAPLGIRALHSRGDLEELAQALQGLGL